MSDPDLGKSEGISSKMLPIPITSASEELA
jgi:hypothetical protein